MTTAHNSSARRYLIPSGSAHFLKSKKELYSGGKNSHEYLMTSIERRSVSSHFESDIHERTEVTFDSQPRHLWRISWAGTRVKCNILFNESLIKVNSSTVGAALRMRQVSGIGTRSGVFLSAKDSECEPPVSPVWRRPLQFVSFIGRGQHFNVSWPRNTADPVCVHRWMSKCWSVQLQWHIPSDPSHQSSEPKRGPPKSPERLPGLRVVQITVLCDGLLTFCFVVGAWRLERWSCVSLSQTELYLMLGRAASVVYNSLGREAVPDRQCYCRPDVWLYRVIVDRLPLQQLQGLFLCTSAATEFIYLAQSKKKRFSIFFSSFT